MRPYAHVDDLCRATILVLESADDQVKSEVFGVGDTAENYQKGMIIRGSDTSMVKLNILQRMKIRVIIVLILKN